MAKKPAAEATLSGKRVVSLANVRNVRIELPDQKFHDFGEDFGIALVNELTESGRFIVQVPPVHVSIDSSNASESFASARSAAEPPPDIEWVGSIVPAAQVTIKVEAMSFQTGARGDRMFYGFNERFRTQFNDGFSARSNEFPLRKGAAEGNTASDSAGSPANDDPSWFDGTFDRRGPVPFDSQSGLDLGDGFQIDALFAWLAVKYAAYHAELHLRMDIQAPLAGDSGLNEYRLITVTGDGYFFDIAGAYAGYSAGISVARRDAMGQAMKKAIAGSYAAIDRALAPLPLTAQVDHVTTDGTVLLGTGPDAAVIPGTIYELIDHPETHFQAILSNSSGTLAQLASGDLALAVPGALVREWIAGVAPLPRLTTGLSSSEANAKLDSTSVSQLAPQLAFRARAEKISASDAPAAVETIQLPWAELPKSDLTDLSPHVSWAQAVWKSIVEAALLPYRIWRYFQYDQSYRALAASETAAFSGSPDAWGEKTLSQPWAKKIGADLVPSMDVAHAPVIAVIDSGVDYNHSAIHGHLWLNPNPTDLGRGGPADRKDYYGWDFVSGDSHPYDDGYHGTEIASLLSAIAPASPVMALKVFNPSGITSSAAIYGAFKYAVDHGARIIVCAWATRQVSAAIQQGVAYAQAQGVVVVAAAGDRGESLSHTPAYPAALSARYDNVLSVAGVDSKDQLLTSTRQGSGGSNFDPYLVAIAAPAEKIDVATPRNQITTDASTGLAAAITAGALARLLASDPVLAAEKPVAWIDQLRREAEVIPALGGKVAGGLRLRVIH